MAMRTLRSSHVAKSMIRVLVEEVGRKFVSSNYLIVLSSAVCGFASRAINEKDEYEARVRKEDRECETIKDRYRGELEFVNAELMKMVREALEK